jgi:excisionase family DNA binding protein
MMEKVYTVAEMAEHFGVSKKSIYNWIEFRGLGPYMTQLGGRFVVREKDLEAYLDSQKVGKMD